MAARSRSKEAIRRRRVVKNRCGVAAPRRKAMPMKFVSWNVNGLRAVMKKGFEDVVGTFDADVFAPL